MSAASDLTSAEADRLRLWLKFRQAAGAAIPAPLFKASVHGWDPATFHQHCDNQGGTVTVVYDS